MSKPSALARNLGYRLHGARLAAGWVWLEGAAYILDVEPKVLEQWEAGQLALDVAQLPYAAAVFGVAVAFVAEGAVEGPRDALASRLARILKATKGRPGELIEHWPMFIKLMRQQHNRGNINAACDALGWLNLTMCAHEIGALSPDIDFQIGYALALGIRPEFAVHLGLPMLPDVDERVDWWRPLEAPESHPAGQLPPETVLTCIRALVGDI